MLRYTRVVLADRSVYGHQAARALPQRNKAIPFSPCPGEHPGIPCWSRPPPGMQPRARACHAHAALVPKAMEAARGQPPLDLPAPGHSLGMGGKLDAALPGVKQVRTHILKGCRNSSAICPPFLLPARDLDPHPQAPQQTLCQAPPNATVLVETGISQVQGSFSCSPAAEKIINSQIRVLRRRKHQRRSS